MIPSVDAKIFPNVTGPKVLFGHSYGGLFTLNALFTRPGLFDTFVAASPSIWFNDRSIAREQEKRFLEGDESSLPNPLPQVFITYGSYEQYPVRKPNQPDDEFERWQKNAREWKMQDNAVDMTARLKASRRLRNLTCTEFPGEDHGGAALCALQRGMSLFLDDLAFEE